MSSLFIKTNFKEKSLYYFHKKIQNFQQKKTQKNILSWFIYVGFFGWVFFGWVFLRTLPGRPGTGAAC